METKYLVAPCGLDCFNCGVFEGNLTEDTRHKVAKFRKISPDEVACKGCREEKGQCLYAQHDCATWECAEKKGVTFCFECDEFPCPNLAPSAKGADYPHNMKVYNLCRMKNNGLDAWMKEAADIRKHYFEGKFVVGKGPVLE